MMEYLDLGSCNRFSGRHEHIEYLDSLGTGVSLGSLWWLISKCSNFVLVMQST